MWCYGSKKKIRSLAGRESPMPATVAAGAAATASGGALLLYLLISTCRSQPPPPRIEGAAAEEEAPLLLSRAEAAREEAWPHSPPVSCCEAARTMRLAWELTVGRWGLHGLTFRIKRHMKRQMRLP